MPGMWYDINHIMSMIDLTWCDIYNTDRYVIRSQAETTEDAESTTEHVRIEQYAIFRFIFSRRKNCIKWTICHVCDTKPTTWCFSSISHDMYTTNCQVCDKKSTTWCYSRGNRTPESEKKQTSVYLMNESSWHDRSRMICTKNDTRNCQVCDTKSITWCFSRGNRTPESEKKQTSVYLMNENSWQDRSRMICTKNYARNCQVCDAKSTTWCSWSISHDVIYDTRYDIRIYLEQKGVNFRCWTKIKRYGILRTIILVLVPGTYVPSF